MTYKAIVEGMTRGIAKQWVQQLLDDNGIKYRWVDCDEASFENDRPNLLWTCKVDIVLENYVHRSVIVGGSADDMIGICCSAIWRDIGEQSLGKEPIWMNSCKSRWSLGIKEFRLD